MFKVLPIHRRTLDRLLHVDRVFRMNPIENKFHGRFRRSVILEDPKGFLGPADLTGRNAPAKAAGAFRPVRSAGPRKPFGSSNMTERRNRPWNLFSIGFIRKTRST